jgi:hypothetical protein
MPVLTPQPRYSGHETFVCRYAWLPKVVRQLAGKRQRPDLFKHEHDAIVRLGVGKNMVRSARFWAESAQVIELCDAVHRVTPFGRAFWGHVTATIPSSSGPKPCSAALEDRHQSRPTDLLTGASMLNFLAPGPNSRSRKALEFLKPRASRNLPKPPSDTTLDAGLRVFREHLRPNPRQEGESRRGQPRLAPC